MSSLPREFRSCPVVCSSVGSITVGDSVHVEVRGEGDGKAVLVSWSHKVRG